MNTKFIIIDKLKPGGIDGTEEINFQDKLTSKYSKEVVWKGTLQDIADLAFSYADILDIPTTEANTALVLKPDGAGGVEWGSDTVTTLTDGNGTTANGTAVDLGGPLTSNTTVGGYSTIRQFQVITESSITLLSYDSPDEVRVYLNQNAIYDSVFDINTAGAFQADRTSTGLGTFKVGFGEVVMGARTANVAEYTKIHLTATEMLVEDNNNNKGLVYASNYTSNYTTRSLVDKGYSDSYFTGALTDGAPTNAEIVAILGTAATNGAGYKAVIKDSDGSGLIYSITCDGTNYYYVVGTQAV